VPRILFLHGDPRKARNDNHQRLPNEFAQRGWQTECLDHETLAVRAGRLEVGGRAPSDFDLIWLIGFGRQASFFDRMQLLRALPQARFVVSVDALTYLHGKHRWLEHMPETYTTSDDGRILEVAGAGGDWVLKPTAASYGRGVARVSDIESARRALAVLRSEQPDGYLILQRFVPGVAEGETRTLVAGGRIVGSYLRRPNDGLKANLAAGAVAEPVELGPERQLVDRIATELAELGAGFAAIDTVHPFLMEVNVANPGGLATLEELGDAAAAGRAVGAVLDWKGLGSG
jgi:hypothetical protein